MGNIFNQTEKRRSWRLSVRRNPQPVLAEFFKEEGDEYRTELEEFARAIRIGKDRLEYLEDRDISHFLWDLKRDGRPIERHAQALKAFFQWLDGKGLYWMPTEKAFTARDV